MTTDAQIETPLAALLKKQIAEKPMSVHDYVNACLHHPELGYYRSQTAIGRQGDFITAPEISQVFGELLGLWSAVVWQAMGTPKHIHLVEIGPGRGTMMKDALRALKVVPAFRAALHVHLIESNPILCDRQSEALKDENVTLTWHQDLYEALGAGGSIPEGPTIILANEFLDTLPIEQYAKNGPYWCQRNVAIEDDTFVFQPTVAPKCPPIPETLEGQERPGDIFEICTGFEKLTQDVLAERAKSHPLAALFIDYGHIKSGFGASLQAVKNHKQVSIFHAPGESDVTAQVDFEAFKAHCLAASEKANTPLAVDGAITQAEFLGSLGIAERTARLMTSNAEAAGRIESGAARLMAPIGMGGRFKVCAVRSASLQTLLGDTPS